MSAQDVQAESRPSFSVRAARAARIAMPFYIGALVISAPFLLGIFAYGLAHASAGAASALIAAIGVLVLIAAVPPFALLSSSTRPFMVALKVLGAVVMATATIGMLMLLNFWLLEPQWMKFRFHRAMNAVDVIAVREEPVQFQGRVIGLRIVRDVVLKRDVELDRYGSHVLGILQELYVDAIERAQDAQSPFDGQVASRLLSINGRDVSADLSTFNTASLKQLVKGRYRTEHTVLLWGLRARDWPRPPCRDEDALTAFATPHEKLSGHALQARSMVRLSLESRRGYEWYQHRALPIQYRYDHPTWLRAVGQLQIETCRAREQREIAEREAAKRLEQERRYEQGDARLSDADNPLFREMCASDVEAVRVRLARGVPPFNLSGKIVDCTIEQPNPDMFAAAMPSLYARAEERDGYCSVLRTIHSRRALVHIDKIGALDLPLVCTSAEDPPPDYRRTDCEGSNAPHRCIARAFSGEHLWRAGLYPSDEKGWVNYDPATRTDTLRWLQLLHTHGVPICKTLPDGTNVLQELVLRAPPEVVHYLVTIGCDAHVHPPIDTVAQREMTDVSAAVHWFMRRHGLARYADQYAALDTREGESVADAMGGLTPSDINHASAQSGLSLLHYIARHLPERPELWRYVLVRGARLDAADAQGRSWFDKGYAQIYGPGVTDEGQQRRLLAMLDELSVAQLRELMAPKNSLTGQPGTSIEEFDFAPGQLTDYLCRRRRIESFCP